MARAALVLGDVAHVDGRSSFGCLVGEVGQAVDESVDAARGVDELTGFGRDQGRLAGVAHVGGEGVDDRLDAQVAGRISGVEPHRLPRAEDGTPSEVTSYQVRVVWVSSR
jgi:hypothetical protein